MAERIEYLEGLRGIAAFVVYVGHFCPLFIVSSSFLLTLITGLFFFGRLFSVCIFFVLSGYVLTYTFFSVRDHQVLVSAAVRRYLRLLVPVSFLIGIVFIFIGPGPAAFMDTASLQALLSQVFWGVFIRGTTRRLLLIRPTPVSCGP
jgi:peptidoglycan/LPS O-acetylase OafA/YrhL